MPQQPATPSNSDYDAEVKAVQSQYDTDVADAQKHIEAGNPVPHPIAARLLEWLPAVGGAAGGVIGGIGGTVGGAVVGGVPGAIGGAALGGATGEAMKQLANRALGNAAPATSAQAAGQIATQAAVQGGSEAVGAAAAPVMKAAGSMLMQTALKPGVVKTAKEMIRTGGDTPKVVQTLLDEGINVTPGGLSKLKDLIGSTNADIKAAVAGAKGTIAKPTVAARTLETASRFAKQTNPTADLKAIGETTQEFLDHPVFQGNLTIPEAQAMKVGTYREIGGKYGQVSSAAIEAQKALARGLKEEIAAAVPKIAPLNKREGDLIQALDAVGTRVAQTGNKDPVGFAWVATHAPMTFLAALIDRNPAVKSMIARGLYNSAGTASQVSPNLIRAAVAGVASMQEPEPPQ